MAPMGSSGRRELRSSHSSTKQRLRRCQPHCVTFTAEDAIELLRSAARARREKRKHASFSGQVHERVRLSHTMLAEVGLMIDANRRGLYYDAHSLTLEADLLRLSEKISAILPAIAS